MKIDSTGVTITLSMEDLKAFLVSKGENINLDLYDIEDVESNSNEEFAIMLELK